MKKLWEFINRPIPNLYMTAAMATVYVLFCHGAAVLSSLVALWLKVDDMLVWSHLGVVLGIFVGFVIYHFGIANSSRKLVRQQQELLDKTLTIWRDLVLRDDSEQKPRRIEGDEWKDG